MMPLCLYVWVEMKKKERIFLLECLVVWREVCIFAAGSGDVGSPNANHNKSIIFQKNELKFV
jgi:hypothetical protein